jgi:hypothetical protein
MIKNDILRKKELEEKLVNIFGLKELSERGYLEKLADINGLKIERECSISELREEIKQFSLTVECGWQINLNINREEIWKRTNLDIISNCDAALQLKEKGYEAVCAIKRGGILWGRLFERMGYTYSEINYSLHKKSMKEPNIEEEDLQKLIGKKVIIAESDFYTGRTIKGVIYFLRDRGINIAGGYIGLPGQPGLIWDSSRKNEYAKEVNSYWKNEKNGSMKLSNGFIYTNTGISKDFEIYTYTNPKHIYKAVKRVSKYLKNTGKI